LAALALEVALELAPPDPDDAAFDEVVRDVASTQTPE
jgi:hypothetical protein